MTENILETNRLILRPICVDDALRINQLCNNKEIASMTAQIPYPCSLDDTKSWINLQAKACENGKEANFAIVIKKTNELIGVIGLEINKQNVRAELGYWIGKDFWNYGFASEAANKVSDYAFNTLKLHRLYASHIKENIASGRILQKIGMQYEGCLKDHIKKNGIFKDMNCYGSIAVE